MFHTGLLNIKQTLCGKKLPVVYLRRKRLSVTVKVTFTTRIWTQSVHVYMVLLHILQHQRHFPLYNPAHIPVYRSPLWTKIRNSHLEQRLQLPAWGGTQWWGENDYCTERHRQPVLGEGRYNDLPVQNCVIDDSSNIWTVFYSGGRVQAECEPDVNKHSRTANGESDI